MTATPLHALALAFLLLSPQASRTASAPASAPSGPPVSYRVSLDAKAKVWKVAMSFTLAAPAPFELWVPRWTPGAYHLADFAQYVTSLSARDASGRELSVVRREPVISWAIDPGTATQVEVVYEATPTAAGALGPILDLEGSRIAARHAYVTPCSLFAFVPELRDRPVEVRLETPAEWSIATALPRRDDGVFTAPSYWRLEDSPFLMGRKLATTSFEVAGVRHEVAALNREGEELDQLAADCKAIVEAAARLMGGLPYRRYTFLFGFLASGSGGLEHSESTLILMPAATPRPALLHVIAHELFHAWNAERIHVEGLDRPEQTRPFTTGTIWLNEGATEYVAGLLLVEAGLQTREQFFRTLARNYGAIQGMREMLTQNSWLDVSRSFTNASMMNFLEIVFTHYQEGSVVLFALDLEMRRATNGERGVPDLMRHLDKRVARTGRGYGEDELPSILNEVAGADLGGFYRRYISGKEMVDLDLHLDVIGKRATPSFGDVDKPTPEQLAAREKLFAVAR